MQFPKGMNLTVDVKECCGAVGDGKHDDTKAIQTAINQTGSYTLLYFPKGQYLVSDTLYFYSSKGSIVSRRNVQGAGVRESTIVLKDKSGGFTDPTSPKPVLHIGAGVAQNFFNHVNNIEISTGTSNPGAVGLRFDANNMGSVRNVSIVCEDSGCETGLDMAYSDQIGPLMVKYLYVYGFRTGVSTGYNVDSMTFEDIHVDSSQVQGAVAAVRNTGQVVTMRHLVATMRAVTTPEGGYSTPPAVLQTTNEPNDAVVTLIDS